jgi:predicted O-linked N-acetylglucosamine transferase (SPINDLY family)
MERLRSGVPTVRQAGERFAARFGEIFERRITPLASMAGRS